MRSISFLTFLSLLLAACGSRPRTSTPQRSFVNMNDPDAAAYIVADISPAAEAGAWRWTGQKPTLRFHLSSTENLKFTMDFSVAEVTFAKTGPLTVTFTVNGHELDRVTYDAPGVKHYEKPVPAEWLRQGAENLVSAETDKVWISEADGARLGFILTRAGFTL